tara:strand:+ start:919 stop:1107 length:189 start_codon:yes stop_codon:yes gene_type:complete
MARMEERKLYRIEWVDSNNLSSHGDWHQFKDLELLQSSIKHLNEIHRGYIRHWIGEKNIFSV